MNHAIQCRCGQLQGSISHPDRAVRAVCYCRDCQAYAHAVGAAASTLDALGGTEVVATQAKYVRFTSAGSLACMSLWARMAACRRTAAASRSRCSDSCRHWRSPACWAGIVTTRSSIVPASPSSRHAC